MTRPTVLKSETKPSKKSKAGGLQGLAQEWDACSVAPAEHSQCRTPDCLWLAWELAVLEGWAWLH